jgi:nicotinamide riboside kinase
MKIAIDGTHSTGKTTICNDFKELHQDYFLIPEVATVYGIEKIPFENRKDIIQYEMLQTQMDIESYHNNFISDRSVLHYGIYGYDEELLNRCIDIMEHRYDLVFYVPIIFPVVDNGFRNTDEKFRLLIDNAFKEYMPIETIKFVSTSRLGRIKEIEEYL